MFRPLALTIALSPAAPRFIDSAATLDLLGITLPHLQVWPESPVLALKVEAALVRYGTQ